jgi:hypothetical protein
MQVQRDDLLRRALLSAEEEEVHRTLEPLLASTSIGLWSFVYPALYILVDLVLIDGSSL